MKSDIKFQTLIQGTAPPTKYILFAKLISMFKYERMRDRPVDWTLTKTLKFYTKFFLINIKRIRQMQFRSTVTEK